MGMSNLWDVLYTSYGREWGWEEREVYSLAGPRLHDLE